MELFAGLKEGIDLSGALQWLNPEGFIDEKNPKRKDQTKTWGEYADVATVGAGVAGIEGLAASLGFEVGYKNGNFVIACNADLCLGLGGSGNVSCKVGADSIGQFFMCVAHQLKQADYSKLTGLMQPIYFKAFNQVLYMVQVGENLYEILSILRSMTLGTCERNTTMRHKLFSAKANVLFENLNVKCARSGAGSLTCRLRHEVQ